MWSRVEWIKTRLTVRQQLVFLKVVIDWPFDALLVPVFPKIPVQEQRYRMVVQLSLTGRVSSRAGFEDGCYNGVFLLSRNGSFRYCSVH